MLQMLAQQKAQVDAIYVCQHAPDADCLCRKPKPGLLHQAAKDLDIDLSRSYVVGDRFKDLQLAANVGAKGILVLTGYGRGELEYYQGEQAGGTSLYCHRPAGCCRLDPQGCGGLKRRVTACAGPNSPHQTERPGRRYSDLAHPGGHPRRLSGRRNFLAGGGGRRPCPGLSSGPGPPPGFPAPDVAGSLAPASRTADCLAAVPAPGAPSAPPTIRSRHRSAGSGQKRLLDFFGPQPPQDRL